MLNPNCLHWQHKGRIYIRPADETVSRIVSFLPAGTEIVAALGLTEQHNGRQCQAMPDVYERE